MTMLHTRMRSAALDWTQMSHNKRERYFSRQCKNLGDLFDEGVKVVDIMVFLLDKSPANNSGLLSRARLAILRLVIATSYVQNMTRSTIASAIGSYIASY